MEEKEEANIINHQRQSINSLDNRIQIKITPAGKSESSIPQTKSKRKINIYDDAETIKFQQKIIEIKKNKQNNVSKQSKQIKAIDIENVTTAPNIQKEQKKFKKQTNALPSKQIVSVKGSQVKHQSIKQVIKQQTAPVHRSIDKKSSIATDQKISKTHKVKINQKLQQINEVNEVKPNEKNDEINNKKVCISTSHIQTPPYESYQSTKSLKSVGDSEFDRLSRKTRETFRSNVSSCDDYLGHIFDFYCKISYPIGKDPTFDQIQKKVKMMPITNYMIFCKDFKIRDKIQRDKLVELFKKHSSFHKYLTTEQFHSVVEDIASILYADFQQQRRYGKMLLFMQIHNSFSFVRKMNQLGVSFRLKNKRGIQVNLVPKYTFKLTPNNGKHEQQIQLQVKQRTILRKILKQQQVEAHRKNKLNKIDQLYKNGNKKKIKAKQNNKKKINKTQIDRDINFKQNSIGKIVPNKSKHQNQIQKPQEEKIEKVACGGYYNPCEILTQRTDNTYKNIHELKKKLLQKHPSDRTFKQVISYSSIPSNSRDYRINNIIAMAKNTIIKEQGYNQYAVASRLTHSKKYKQYGSIIKQNISTLNKSNFESGSTDENDHANECLSTKPVTIEKIKYIPRLSREIKMAELFVQDEIKKLPRTIFEKSEKSKQYLRATAKIHKQNTKQINQLQQMIGLNDPEQDQILQMHFQKEKQYEKTLSKVQRNI